VSGLVGAVLAIAFLLAPPLGTDLSAQVARADFIREYGLSPVDLRWYGGTVQYGYSLVSPAVMAVLGARLTGALAAVISSFALAALFVATGARRPVLSGIMGALCFTGNLVSGRVTFALGVAFGLLGLLALAAAPQRWLRIGGAIGGASLASATSPVAGLFVGLAGIALAASGRAWRWPGLLLAGAAGVPLAAMALLFGEGGRMNISRADAVHAIVTSVVIALVVPRRPVRIGAVLSGLGVLAAFVVTTPVGLNATRLATMFALPVAVAYVVLPDQPRGWVLKAALVAAVVGWQPPVLIGDLRDVGNPTASPAYSAPLVAELARRRPIGRIEVPPTREYWEAAYVADAVPLARGWLRQLDLGRNGLFFDGTLSASSYEAWLRDNGVSHVALPDAELSWVGRGEGALIRGGLPYLTEVWRDAHWTLFEVTGRPSIVDGARLVSATGAAVTFDVTEPGDVLIRVRWSRWLRVSGPRGAGLAPGSGGWTSLPAPAPGRYTLTSG
jgi:MFS family permease